MNSHNKFTGTGPWQTYQDALRDGEFLIQHCGQCNQYVFYPRVLCKNCGSNDLKWITPSGQGTVYSTSVVRQKPEFGPDYNISLVDLEEGPRMLTRVVEIEPGDVTIGMKVTGYVGEIDGQPAFLFRPEGGGKADGS